ncbi:MAG: formylglycine-generating enzyme family protein [Deltaproteobacteria bacterium]|nr:formylglycine-generating enzyme family protein [Deltaproteobacteria bacterium]
MRARAALVALAMTIATDVHAQHVMIEAPIVWIPEGAFTLGADPIDLEYAIQLCQDEHELTLADGCTPERFQNELSSERPYLRRFGIDRTEVTRARYAECVEVGRCAPSHVSDDDPELGAPSVPVVGVDARDAARYCAFRGGRLPTESEWEKAARGTEGNRRFPWGRVYDGGLANHGRPVLRPDASDGWRGLAPVGVLQGRSPYGLADMAGNAWEWTSSRLRPIDVGTTARPTDRDLRLVLRGGSFLHPAVSMRVTSRSWMEETRHAADVGFRCAYDPP